MPASVKELRSFLGFAGYYRRFISGFAQIAGPPHELVNSCLHELKVGKRLTIPFTNRWNKACQTVFEVLREKLTTAPVIAFPDFRPMQVKKDLELFYRKSMMGNTVLLPMPAGDSDLLNVTWITIVR